MMNTAFLLLGTLFLAGCAQLTPEEHDFKTVCEAHKDAFMKMEEMRDGQAINPPCFGCMADVKTHICDKEEYLKYEAEKK